MMDTVRALQEGNHEAFERLFDTWYVPLCRYAYSILRDLDEAEDIVQKTFCKLWDQHSDLRINSSINSYLYRIVHNDCLNFIHQQINRKEHNFQYLNSKSESENSVVENLVSSELQLAIDKAFASLPPQCRKVFELSRNEQLPYAQIATELSISVNTVENHMSKALKLLRIELKEYLYLLIICQLIK